MNDPTPPDTTPAAVARPTLDVTALLALAAGLAMGHVVRALAQVTMEPGVALASAVFFVVFGAASTVCALASIPRAKRVGPRFGLWITAVGAGLLGALAPPLLF